MNKYDNMFVLMRFFAIEYIIILFIAVVVFQYQINRHNNTDNMENTSSISVCYFELINNRDLWPIILPMLDTKSLWRLRQTCRGVKIQVDKWAKNKKMEWPFFSNLMLQSDNRTRKSSSLILHHVVTSRDNTKLALLIDANEEKNQTRCTPSRMSKILVYDINIGKIAEFITDKNTKPVFSLDGSIIIAGGPKPTQSHLFLHESLGLLVCDLLVSDGHTMPKPIHQFKKTRFGNIHFVTNDFIWCDQNNQTRPATALHHMGFRLRRNRSNKIICSCFNRNENPFVTPIQNDGLWVINIVSNASTKVVIEYGGTWELGGNRDTGMSVIRLDENRTIVSSQRVDFWGNLTCSNIEISKSGRSIVVVNKTYQHDINDMARIATYKITNTKHNFITEPEFIRGRILITDPFGPTNVMPSRPVIWSYDDRWLIFGHSFDLSPYLSDLSPCCIHVTRCNGRVLQVGREDTTWSPNIWNIMLNGKSRSVWPASDDRDALDAVNIERLYRKY